MFAIADSALADGVIIVNPLDNDAGLAALNENVFCIAKQTESFAGVVANGMIDEGIAAAALLHFNGDKFMPTMARHIAAIFERAGGKPLLFPYAPGTADFSAPLTQAREQAVGGLVFLGYDETKLAMQQADSLGFDSKRFFAINTVAGIEGSQIAHFTYLDGNPRIARSMLGRFQEKYGVAPILSWLAFQAYDSTNIVIDAAKKARSQEGTFAENLRRNVLATRDFHGTAGDISMKPDGTSRGIYASLYTVAGGQVVRK